MDIELSLIRGMQRDFLALKEYLIDPSLVPYAEVVAMSQNLENKLFSIQLPPEVRLSVYPVDGGAAWQIMAWRDGAWSFEPEIYDTAEEAIAVLLYAITAEYPAWVGGVAYSAGARVAHAGKNWESQTDNNYGEPGKFGWVEI